MTDYNVAKLAADLDLEPHIVRTKLRAAQVEKNEGKYEWAKEKDYLAVLKQLKSDAKSTPKAETKKAEPKGKKGVTVAETKNAGKAPEDKGAKKPGKKSRKEV